jgi:hypothetical protein
MLYKACILLHLILPTFKDLGVINPILVASWRSIFYSYPFRDAKSKERFSEHCSQMKQGGLWLAYQAVTHRLETCSLSS